MKSAIALLFALWSGLASAGAFQDAYAAALSMDATFQGARAELASSLQNLPMARAGLLPNIALAFSNSQVEGSRTIDGPNQAGTTPLDYRAPARSLTIRTPVINREAWEKVTMAEAQVRYAEALFASRRIELFDRLASAYLQRMVAEEAVLAARAQIEATRAQDDLARRRLQLGEGTRPDAAEAAAARAMAQAMLTEAEGQLTVARLALRQIVGSDPASRPSPGPAQSVLLRAASLAAAVESLPDLLLRADASSPAIAARRHAVAVAQAAVARNRAGHYPRLDLIASASASRNESLSTLNQSVHQRILGFQLNVPLYAGGYVTAATKQALADQEKAEADLASEQLSQARELTRLYLLVDNGAAKIAAQEQTVGAALLTVEGNSKGLTAGATTMADVVQSQNKVALARQDLARAVFDYLLARVRLLARAGVDLDDVVVQIDALLATSEDRAR